MVSLELALVFVVTFLMAWVLCSHNVTLAKVLCPASLATALTLLFYFLLGSSL